MDGKEIRLGVPREEGQLSIVFSKGGSREGAGRKGFGITKKISLTLTEETWDNIERRCLEDNISRSEVIRGMIDTYFSIPKEER